MAIKSKIVRVGCAGWTIPRAAADRFPADGSHLERFAQRFSAVEINSSFYRPHRRQTYERWGQSVPLAFRFSVKVPKQITHELRLHDAAAAIDDFLEGVTGLGQRLGCLLVQLPPSLDFDGDVADAFFTHFRREYQGPIACEPRHATWFAPTVAALWQQHQISRVAADPPPVIGAEVPGGSQRFRYFRLHGSPRIYYSQYTAEFLSALALQVKTGKSTETWCIFDNTAANHAVPDALQLQQLLDES